MKLIFHAILLVVTLFFWKGFADSGNEIETLQERIEQAENMDEDADKVQELKSEKQSVEVERMLMGMMLTIGSCAVAGIFIWAYLLPFLADRATHAIFDSGEMVEKDKMQEAHSLMAQGDYEAAIDAFREVADEDPANRMPWVEMAKIQRKNLNDPNAAVAIFKEALVAHEWEQDDAAFLMFRLAEIHNEDLDDRAAARAIMQQVIDTFPESRHSANATHKLHEWEREDEEKALIDQLHGQDSGSNPPA